MIGYKSNKRLVMSSPIFFPTVVYSNIRTLLIIKTKSLYLHNNEMWYHTYREISIVEGWNYFQTTEESKVKL